jgi:hypothetical protein
MQGQCPWSRVASFLGGLKPASVICRRTDWRRVNENLTPYRSRRDVSFNSTTSSNSARPRTMLCITERLSVEKKRPCSRYLAPPRVRMLRVNGRRATARGGLQQQDSRILFRGGRERRAIYFSRTTAPSYFLPLALRDFLPVAVDSHSSCFWADPIPRLAMKSVANPFTCGVEPR